MSGVLAALTLCLVAPAAPIDIAARQAELTALVNKPYLELLEIAPDFEFPAGDFERARKQLESGKKAEKQRLESEENRLKKEIEGARRGLDRLNRGASRDSEPVAAERRELHCKILKLERELQEVRAMREHGLRVAFENKHAKLDLLQQWPARKRLIEQTVASGKARERRFGDVEDIGVRKLGEDQAKDIKLGEDAIRELKAYGLLPAELENDAVRAYVRKLSETVAAGSDLRIPVRTTVLISDEINAFALPGGFLFVNTGLLQKAGSESELAGVMAHELAHVAARHGPRLMKRAQVAGIIYEVARVTAIIFTGGAAGIGAYYALQYGFFGLGMVLDLALLGVSRDYEIEADQLGAQYAWRSGYDPRGFITFFDRMASEKGYVTSASFFRTHPPFFERIVTTFGEIEYLPPKENLRVDSQEFQQAKTRLEEALRGREKDPRKRPTLHRFPECDDERE